MNFLEKVGLVVIVGAVGAVVFFPSATAATAGGAFYGLGTALMVTAFA